MSVDYESRFPQHTRKRSAAFQDTTVSGGVETRSTPDQKQPLAFRTASKFSADANLFFTPPQHSSVIQTQTHQNNVLSTTNNPPRSDFDGVRHSLTDALPNVSKSEQFVHETFEMLKSEVFRVLEKKKSEIMQKLREFHQPVVLEVERRLKLVDSLQSWACESSEANEAPPVRRSLYQDQNDDNLLSIAQQIGKFDDIERQSNNKKELLKQISNELGRLQTDAAFMEIKKISGQVCPYLNKGEIQVASKEILSRLEQNTSQYFGDHKVFSDQTFFPLDVNSLRSETRPINVRSEVEMKKFEDHGNRMPATGSLAQIAFSLEDGSIPVQQTTTSGPNPKFAKPRGLNQNLSAMVLSNLYTLKAAPVQANNRMSAVQLYCSRQHPQSAHATLPVTSTAYTDPLKPHVSRILHTPDYNRTLATRNPIRPPQQTLSTHHAANDRAYHQTEQDGQKTKPLTIPALSSTNLSVVALSSFSGLDACLDKNPPTCVTSLAGRPGWLAIGTAHGKVLLTDLGVQRMLSFDTEQPVTLLDGSRPNWLLTVLADSTLCLHDLSSFGASRSAVDSSRRLTLPTVSGNGNDGNGNSSSGNGRVVVRDMAWDEGVGVWVVACSDGCVRVVAEGFGERDRLFSVAPGKDMLSICCLPGHGCYVVGFEDGTIQMVSSKHGGVIGTLQDSSPIMKVVSLEGMRIATFNSMKNIKIWDLDTMSLQDEVLGTFSPVLFTQPFKTREGKFALTFERDRNYPLILDMTPGKYQKNPVHLKIPTHIEDEFSLRSMMASGYQKVALVTPMQQDATLLLGLISADPNSQYPRLKLLSISTV